MAPSAATTPATSPSPSTLATNDGEASSLQAVVDLAATFPLPSMAAAEPTPGSGAGATVDDLTTEEENQADRSRYWLQSCVTEDHLVELVEGGFLPTKADCAWRAPGNER